MSSFLLATVSFGSILLFTGCSSVPKPSLETISVQEAENFLNRYCSKYSPKENGNTELVGEILVRSSTREFKGQYPASIRFSKDGSYTLEVTNLIGGTVAMLKGNSAVMTLQTPGRPQYDRSAIREYMGISSGLFAEFIHGDLPCPRGGKLSTVQNRIILKTPTLEWRLERSDSSSGGVPVRLTILEKEKVRVDMTIEKWNLEESYPEKVKVQTSDGSLKWTWRSRVLNP